MTVASAFSLLASAPFANFCYAALGAFSLWLRLKYGANLVISIEQLVNEIFDDFRFRMLVTLLIFVSLGSIFSIIIIDPTSRRQAFAAGATCTVLLGNLTVAAQKRAG